MLSVSRLVLTLGYARCVLRVGQIFGVKVAFAHDPFATNNWILLAKSKHRWRASFDFNFFSIVSRQSASLVLTVTDVCQLGVSEFFCIKLLVNRVKFVVLNLNYGTPFQLLVCSLFHARKARRYYYLNAILTTTPMESVQLTLVSYCLTCLTADSTNNCQPAVRVFFIES